MDQAAPTRVDPLEHVGCASVLPQRVQGVTELLSAAVPAGRARIGAGRIADPAFRSARALPFDADVRLAE